MDFEELENRVYNEIIFADDIAAQTSTLLNQLTGRDVFMVCRLAKKIDTAIARELAFKDGDMVTVIQTLGAVLDTMTKWLRSHGVKPRLLRSTKAIDIEVK